MKPKLRDYLIILFALLAIFFCGAGVGFLIGEKSSQREPAPAVVIPPDSDDTPWEKRTMERLTTLISLTREQHPKVEAEIKATSAKIRQSREEAVRHHYQVILELHDRLLPHLEPNQQEKIKKDRESLQRAIDSRFSSPSE